MGPTQPAPAQPGPPKPIGHKGHGQEPRPPPAFPRRPCRARQAARALKTASPVRAWALVTSAAPPPPPYLESPPGYPHAELAAAALDLPLLSTFEPSQHHQELQAVELRIPCLSPSLARHRTAAAAWRPSRHRGRPPPAGFWSSPPPSIAGGHKSVTP
jgi:hypothetical protein